MSSVLPPLTLTARTPHCDHASPGCRMDVYLKRVLARECEYLTPDAPLFRSSWGQRSIGRIQTPMAGKNIWRLGETYGNMIGCPELKPHDLWHGVAVEVLEQRHDLEEVPALLGHT